MKKFLGAIAVLAGVGGIGVTALPAEAQSGARNIYEYTYYYDAAKTSYAGMRVEHCNNVDVFGDVTPYWTRVQTGRCTPGGGGEW